MKHTSINIGPFSITLYSICILFGIIMASVMISEESKKNDIKSYFVTNLMFWIIVFGIIGARIYYVLFNLDYYLSYPIEIIKIWNGGLAIHGGIIAGLITSFIYCKKYKVNYLKILDILAPAVILAQGIGRWGNFFNGEAYGSIVDRIFLENLHIPQFIIDGMNINGVYHHPTFLYESIFCVIGCFVLIGLRSSKNTKVGNTIALYSIWYGILRFFIESLRTDSLMLGNFKIAQVVSVLMIIIGIITFIITSIKGDLYNDDRKNKDIKI